MNPKYNLRIQKRTEVQKVDANRIRSENSAELIEANEKIEQLERQLAEEKRKRKTEISEINQKVDELIQKQEGE